MKCYIYHPPKKWTTVTGNTTFLFFGLRTSLLFLFIRITCPSC